MPGGTRSRDGRPAVQRQRSLREDAGGEGATAGRPRGWNAGTPDSRGFCLTVGAVATIGEGTADAARVTAGSRSVSANGWLALVVAWGRTCFGCCADCCDRVRAAKAWSTGGEGYGASGCRCACRLTYSCDCPVSTGFRAARGGIGANAVGSRQQQTGRTAGRGSGGCEL